jgi:hypothetical protein
MDMERIKKLHKLQTAWSQRKLAMDTKVVEVQRQKTEILTAVQEVAILMRSENPRDLKFVDFATKHLIFLSQKLAKVNVNLDAQLAQRRSISENERRVEKLTESAKLEVERNHAFAECTEVLELVMISIAENARKLATSQS